MKGIDLGSFEEVSSVVIVVIIGFCFDCPFFEADFSHPFAQLCKVEGLIPTRRAAPATVNSGRVNL